MFIWTFPLSLWHCWYTLSQVTVATVSFNWIHYCERENHDNKLRSTIKGSFVQLFKNNFGRNVLNNNTIDWSERGEEEEWSIMWKFRVCHHIISIATRPNLEHTCHVPTCAVHTISIPSLVTTPRSDTISRHHTEGSLKPNIKGRRKKFDSCWKLSICG